MAQLDVSNLMEQRLVLERAERRDGDVALVGIPERVLIHEIERDYVDLHLRQRPFLVPSRQRRELDVGAVCLSENEPI
jgi:hypothetical protein